LLTSGKCYYDLVQHREETGRSDVAIVRVEELYPVPEAELLAVLEAYPEETPVVWVQEEPENMGAWRFLYCHFGDRLFNRHPFSMVARAASASPATGSQHSHRIEQHVLMEQAFTD
jgi:2-oxoglutarate dehydrogenase E1 component